MIKGWTTDATSRHLHACENSNATSDREEVESQRDWEESPSERGAHIYKHVIKGWTMDPNANDVYRRIYQGEKLEADTSKCENNEETAVYRLIDMKT